MWIVCWKSIKTKDKKTESSNVVVGAKHHKRGIIIVENKPQDSELKRFFENKGLKVIDNRHIGKHLWVMGEKDEIKKYIDEAGKEFSVSGAYGMNKDEGFKNGWYTKSKKWL